MSPNYNSKSNFEPSALLSSPGAQLPRSAEAALRRATPAFNPDVEALQRRMEDIAYLLRIPQRKPWGSMAQGVEAALALVTEQRCDPCALYLKQSAPPWSPPSLPLLVFNPAPS